MNNITFAVEVSVFLPQDSIIAQEKLTQYLLVPLLKDDKSAFLAQAGYVLGNWQQLERDLRTQVLTLPAELVETNCYGQKYLIHARLRGINGIDLNVVTVWMSKDGITRFITLVSDKGSKL